ncbi:MAG: hypothetical protein LBD75_06050 [Candidatus Peribacteria bacterium]|jgi:hypothetical protein|nr:hypothetical protein [Candidatus Peribacteria bacterium]
MTTQEELLYWKDAVAEQATNGFIVDNNTLSTDYNGSKTLNRYVIKDKEETVSLDDTIRFEYAIPHWFIPEACHVVENNSIEHSFMGDKDQYSRNTIKNYRLTTVDEFRTQEEKEIENFLSYQICGNDYPFQWGNFDTIYLNQLLYSVSHPSRYIIYKVNLEQDTAFSLFSNIEVAFLD